jgi:guanine nucleotide-binding protein G(i) subunit alpha
MDGFNIKLAVEGNKSHALLLKGTTPTRIQGDGEDMLKGFGEATSALWQDAGVQACYARSKEYQIDQSAK